MHEPEVLNIDIGDSQVSATTTNIDLGRIVGKLSKGKGISTIESNIVYMAMSRLISDQERKNFHAEMVEEAVRVGVSEEKPEPEVRYFFNVKGFHFYKFTGDNAEQLEMNGFSYIKYGKGYPDTLAKNNPNWIEIEESEILYCKIPDDPRLGTLQFEFKEPTADDVVITKLDGAHDGKGIMLKMSDTYIAQDAVKGHLWCRVGELVIEKTEEDEEKMGPGFTAVLTEGHRPYDGRPVVDPNPAYYEPTAFLKFFRDSRDVRKLRLAQRWDMHTNPVGVKLVEEVWAWVPEEG